MKVVNIAEAKAKLSEYIDAAAAGERVLICKRNQPVAELRAVPSARIGERPIGLAAGLVDVPAAFFDPLPDAIVAEFAGDEPARPARLLSRVAERRPEYRVGGDGRRRGK
jgi:antitoxin (DNA-binding transcriptional repressor) of toxin-antitoxin stability system